MGSGVGADDAAAVFDVDADGDVDLADAAAYAAAFDDGPQDCDADGVQDFVQIARGHHA